MKQKFERVRDPAGTPTPGLYRRVYGIATGEMSVLYYGRLKSKRDGKRMLFALGPNLQEAKDEWSIITVKNRRKESLEEYKPEKKNRMAADPDTMTVEQWSKEYLAKEEVTRLKSHDRECDYAKHVNGFFGQLLLTEVKRMHLFQYRKQRLGEFVIRNGKPSAKRVSPGEVTNELSFLRKMLRAARADEIPVSIPSFADKNAKKTERLMWRNPGRDRILEPEEETKLMEFYPLWLKRMAVFARETALNQDDTIELTWAMIDRKNRLVKLPDGRNKTGQEQIPFLSDVALQVLDDIDRDRKSGAILSNLDGLVFTTNTGGKLNKDMVTGTIRRARKRTGVADFRYHDYRHMAQTNWALKNVSGPIAMKMAGLASPQMLQRYQNIKPRHVSEYMLRLENGSMNARQQLPSQAP